MLQSYISVSLALKALPNDALCLGSVLKPKFVNEDDDTGNDELENGKKRLRFNAQEELLRLEERYQNICALTPSIMTAVVELKELSSSSSSSAASATSTAARWFTLKKQPFPDSVEEILKSCVPSPFGNLKSGKTEIDLKVRSAFENKDDVGLTQEGTDFLEKHFTAYLAGFLYGALPIKLVLNKLNVYGPKGFFAKHTDTPRPGVVGTLVVELPFVHVGGQLELLPNNDETTPVKIPDRKAWTDDTLARNRWRNNGIDPSRSFRLTAFYGNIPHRITPVEENHRVTITFYITSAKTTISTPPTTSVAASASSSVGSVKETMGDEYVGMWNDYHGDHNNNNNNKMIGECRVQFDFLKKSDNTGNVPIDGYSILINRFVEELVNLQKSATENDDIKKPTKRQKKNNKKSSLENEKEAGGISVGILLSQEYSHSEIANKRWKGLDSVLMRSLVDHVYKISGLTIEFMPVVVWHEEEWYPFDAGFDTDPIRHQSVYRFTEDDIKQLSMAAAKKHANSSSSSSSSSRSSKHIEIGLNEIKVVPLPPKPKFSFLGAENWKALYKFRQEGASHTGNEALANEILNYYFSTACLITTKK